MNLRSAFLAFTTATISTLFCLILIEIALQFMPVQSYMPVAPVTPQNPVTHYKPNIKYTYSAGRNFDALNKGRVNAQGWISNFDYAVHDSNKPVITVIGDSYVEARMVPFEKTFHGILRENLGAAAWVYNFAMGGAPLSQYLIWARHARDTYNPSFLIVNIVGNDFDESLPHYKNKPRFHYFITGDNGALEPQLIGTYKESFFKNLIARSALVRYLYFHLQLSNTVNAIQFRARDNQKTASTDVPQQRLTDSYAAIDAFLNLLPDYSGLPKDKIVLVIDGMRRFIYHPENQHRMGASYFGQTRRYFIQEAKKHGFTVIDMHPAFDQHYRQHGQKFDFAQDYHWNSLGHSVVAAQIKRSKPYKDYTSAFLLP